MGATTRVSISWGANEPTEPTDTLVLTSPGHHFVDIRLHRGSTNEAAWAFCGTTSSQGAKTTYTHELDSLGYTADDSGEFEVLPGGELRETGRMVNPESGREEDYIETWRRISDSESSPKGFVLEKRRGSQLVGKIVCVDRFMQGIQDGGKSWFRASYSDQWHIIASKNFDVPSALADTSEWTLIEGSR